MRSIVPGDIVRLSPTEPSGLRVAYASLNAFSMPYYERGAQRKISHYEKLLVVSTQINMCPHGVSVDICAVLDSNGKLWFTYQEALQCDE